MGLPSIREAAEAYINERARLEAKPMPAPLCFASPGWHVIYTEPKAEDAVNTGISDIGFKAYLPVEKMLDRTKRETISRPLFPRYLFVSFDTHNEEQWAPILDTDGVVDLLRNDNVPSRIPTAAVDMLMKAESFGVFDRTLSKNAPFAIGERVRISDGPFTGLNATIQKFIAKLGCRNATRRVKVLVDFMHQATPFELDICNVEKI